MTHHSHGLSRHISRVRPSLFRGGRDGYIAELTCFCDGEPCICPPAVYSDTGKLERKNPLPVGRYWQDIFKRQANDWNAWLSGALRSGAVTIEKAEHFNADPLHDGSWLPGGNEGDLNVISDRTWVLFNVVRPVEWPATKLGFPTVADSSVQTSADTVTNPPGPSPLDEISDAVKEAARKAEKALETGLIIGGVGLVLWVFRKELFK